MDQIIKDFKETGPCEIDIDEAVKIWDKDWLISQWRNDYTLCHQNLKSDNFTKTDFKVTITKEQAHQLIDKLDLVGESSHVFASGRTWRIPKKSK